MKKVVFLDRETLGQDLSLESWQSHCELIIFDRTNPQQVVERSRDAQGIILNKIRLTKEVIDQLPKLEFVFITATGQDNVDLEYCKQKNIVVKNVVGYATESVVAQTFAMTLGLSQRVQQYNNFVLNGAWSESGIFTSHSFPFREPGQLNWTIIGMGNIGRRVAQIAREFGYQVSYFSTSGTNKQSDYPEISSLDEVFKSSNIVSIHSPLNDRTKNLIRKSHLDLMDDDGIVVNMGRGSIINEDDLYAVNSEERLYFGIDVFSKEPMDKQDQLLKLKHPARVLFSPHIAWASNGARKTIVKTIASYLNEIS